MSTRCNIGFYDAGWAPPAKMTMKKAASEAAAILYRHSDGEPDAAGADVERLAAQFRGLRGFYDSAYCAARVLAWMVAEYDTLMVGLTGRQPVTGFGVCRQLMGDIEYYYAVHQCGVTAYEVTDAGTLVRRENDA